MRAAVGTFAAICFVVEIRDRRSITAPSSHGLFAKAHPLTGLHVAFVKSPNESWELFYNPFRKLHLDQSDRGYQPLSQATENRSARRSFLKGAIVTGAAAVLTSPLTGQPLVPPTDDRSYLISVVQRISDPVLRAVSEGKLRSLMPVEASS